MNVECRNSLSESSDENMLCAGMERPVKVISFPVYFESTSRKEMEQVAVEICFPVGSLNDVP